MPPQSDAPNPPPTPDAPAVHRVAPPHRLYRRALGLLLTGRDAPRDPRVAAFEAYAQRAGLDASTLHAALDPQQRPRAAAVAMTTPGRAAMVLISPLRNAHQHTHAAAQCVELALQALPPATVTMAQTLLDLDQIQEAHALEKAGFHQLARLIYMQADLPKPTRFKRSARPPLPELQLRNPQTSDPLELQTWNDLPDTRDAFGQAILDSYHDTQDCPGLVGTRSIDDILAGHRGSPGTQPFDPTLWTLVRQNQQPVAVLLLSPLPEQDAVELVYLGVAHAARGQGLGQALIQYAIALAAQRHAKQMLLAVDEANDPALTLYRAAGFRPQQRRLAMVRFLT